MRKKELKNIAHKIAKYEKVIQESSNREEVENAKKEILALSKKLSVEDMFLLDEVIMELMEE